MIEIYKSTSEKTSDKEGHRQEIELLYVEFFHIYHVGTCALAWFSDGGTGFSGKISADAAQLLAELSEVNGIPIDHKLFHSKAEFRAFVESHTELSKYTINWEELFA